MCLSALAVWCICAVSGLLYFRVCCETSGLLHSHGTLPARLSYNLVRPVSIALSGLLPLAGLSCCNKN